jgi:hypothetical protein
MIAAARADLRAELQRQQQADEDFAIACARADAARRSPFWPFGTLTPAQQRARAAQEEAMRCGVLRRTPEALL